MRVLVCGSRGYGRLDLVRARVRMFDANTVLIVGGARGPDLVAERVGREVGMDVRVFRPDWKRYGRSAGHRRNAEMVDELQRGPDPRLVVAFHDGASHGTMGTIQEARRRGLDVEIWGNDGQRIDR